MPFTNYCRVIQRTVLWLLLSSVFLFSCKDTTAIVEVADGDFYESSLVVAHRHSEYPYTTYNQSMAVWGGKAFCFNDTSRSKTHGFCIIIDTNTGEVIARIMDTPYVLSPSGYGASHLNNACFTDQYFASSDAFPLLLISRGDYPNSKDKKGEELYVFRVIEESGSFSFTRIKTIITKHDYLTTHNPSWDYDSKRKMIWGHCLTEDWRWGEYVGAAHRSFNMSGGMYFKAFGTSYVCLESRDVAVKESSVTIQIGQTSRTVKVKVGDRISAVFPYEENDGGCCFIRCSQDAQAFSKKFDVYSCEEDGGNKKQIKLQAAIVGFASPSLSDTSTVIINNNDFSEPSYIGDGVLQGGCCFDGKLYLPFHNFGLINGRLIDYHGPVCLVVNPLNGYVEKTIQLASPREPEGCAFYDGSLYISHHVGNATDKTAEPSFEIYKYTFK